MKSMWQVWVVGAALGSSQPALAGSALAFDPQVGQMAQGMFQLNSLIMLASLGVFVAVFAAMFYSLLKHRKSAGQQVVHFHENTMVEVIWTVIPFIILIGVAYPATKTIIEHQAVGDFQLEPQQVASR